MLMFEDFMLMTWSRLPHLAISQVSRLCPPSSQINWLHTTAKNLKIPWIMLVIICSLWSCLSSTLSTLPEAKKEESPQRWPLRFRLSFLCQLWQQFCQEKFTISNDTCENSSENQSVWEQCSLDLDGEHSSENQFDASSAPLKTQLQQFNRSKNLAVT